MTLRIPNSCAQSGVYSSATPLVQVLVGMTPEPGRRTFSETASADGWVLDDTVYIRVSESDSQYWIGLATWDSASLTLTFTTEELAVGTLTDSAGVLVEAVITSDLLASLSVAP